MGYVQNDPTPNASWGIRSNDVTFVLVPVVAAVQAVACTAMYFSASFTSTSNAELCAGTLDSIHPFLFCLERIRLCNPSLYDLLTCKRNGSDDP